MNPSLWWHELIPVCPGNYASGNLDCLEAGLSVAMEGKPLALFYSDLSG